MTLKIRWPLRVAPFSLGTALLLSANLKTVQSGQLRCPALQDTFRMRLGSAKEKSINLGQALSLSITTPPGGPASSYDRFNILFFPNSGQRKTVCFGLEGYKEQKNYPASARVFFKHGKLTAHYGVAQQFGTVSSSWACQYQPSKRSLLRLSSEKWRNFEVGAIFSKWSGIYIGSFLCMDQGKLAVKASVQRLRPHRFSSKQSLDRLTGLQPDRWKQNFSENICAPANKMSVEGSAHSSNALRKPADSATASLPPLFDLLRACKTGAKNLQEEEIQLELQELTAALPKTLDFPELEKLASNDPEGEEEAHQYEAEQDIARENMVGKLTKTIHTDVSNIHNVSDLGNLFIRLGRLCTEPIEVFSEDLAQSCSSIVLHRNLTSEQRSRIDALADIVQKIVNGLLAFVPGYSAVLRIMSPLGATFMKLGEELLSFSGGIQKLDDGINAVKIATQALFGHAPLLSDFTHDREALFNQVAKYCQAFPIQLREGEPRIEVAHQGRVDSYRLYYEAKAGSEEFYVVELDKHRLNRVPVYFDVLNRQWQKLNLENLSAKKEVQIGKAYGISRIKSPLKAGAPEAMSDPNIFLKENYFSPLTIQTAEGHTINAIALGGALVPVIRAKESWYVYSVVDRAAPLLEVRFEAGRWHLTEHLPDIHLNVDLMHLFEARSCLEPKNLSGFDLFPNQYGVYTAPHTSKKYLYIHLRPYAVDKFLEICASTGERFGVVSFSGSAGQCYRLSRQTNSTRVLLEAGEQSSLLNQLWENELQEVVASYSLEPFIQRKGWRQREKIEVSSFSPVKACLPFAFWKSAAQPLSSAFSRMGLQIITMYGHRLAAKLEDQVHAKIFKLQNLQCNKPQGIYALCSEGAWRLDLPRIEEEQPSLLNRLKEYVPIPVSGILSGVSQKGRSEFMITSAALSDPLLGSDMRSGQLLHFKRDQEGATPTLLEDIALLQTSKDFLMRHAELPPFSFESSGRLFHWRSPDILAQFAPKLSLPEDAEDIEYFLKHYPRPIDLVRLEPKDVEAYGVTGSSKVQAYLIEEEFAPQRPLAYMEAFRKLYGENASFLAVTPQVNLGDGVAKCHFSLFMKRISGQPITQLAKDISSGLGSNKEGIDTAKAFLKKIFSGTLEQWNERLRVHQILHNALNLDYVLYDPLTEEINLTHFDSATVFPYPLDEKNEMIQQMFAQQRQDLYGVVFEFAREIGSRLSSDTETEISVDVLEQLLKGSQLTPEAKLLSDLIYCPDEHLYKSSDNRRFIWTKFQNIFEIDQISGNGEIVFLHQLEQRYRLRKNNLEIIGS